jgi:hypothetical protein
MKVVGHQAVGGADPAVPGDGAFEASKESETIAVISEDVLAAIAAGGDVIRPARLF